MSEAAGSGENELFRLRREALLSPSGSGEEMSQAELAASVNEYLVRTGRRKFLDAPSISRYERGKVTWPGPVRREALRAVMGVATDAELGFYKSWPTGVRSSAVHGSGRAAAGDVVGAVADLLDLIGSGPGAGAVRLVGADSTGTAGGDPVSRSVVRGALATIRIEVVVAHPAVFDDARPGDV